ncbi:hypothetical protein FGF1_40580 [Flavobacteriaceae bacterium GF1]
MRNRFQSIIITALIMVIVGLLLMFLVDTKWEHYNKVSSIGLSLITTALIAITLDRISIAIFSRNLNKVVENGIGELKVRNYGITEVLDNTPYTNLYTDIRNSNEFILVQTWCPYMKPILKPVEDLLYKGGKIKIFLLHPNSVVAAQRSLDLEEEYGHVPSKILADTANIRTLYKKLLSDNRFTEQELETKLNLYYSVSLPAFALYKTDKKALIAFYWHGTQSDNAMTAIVDFNNKNKAASHINDHLKVLEKNASKVNLNDSKEVQIKYEWQRKRQK